MGMKKIEVLVDEDFKLPDEGHLEYRNPKEGEKYLSYVDRHWYRAKSHGCSSGYLVFIPKAKKYTYDFPESFADGVRLVRDKKYWVFYENDSVLYGTCYSTLIQLMTLPKPPQDAPVGTVITKGEQ